MSDSKRVFIYDCTLRDGTQGERISLSVEDKIHIAQKLDAFGMDYIEGGWPGSNQKDVGILQACPGFILEDQQDRSLRKHSLP